MTAPTVEDRNEITDVLYRYCRGIDRLDEGLVRSCYHPDAIDNHGLYSGSVDHFVQNAFRRQSATVIVASHTMHQSLIEVEGDAAVVETYANAVERSRDDADRLIDTLVGLRYIDRFERRGGPWLIARRTVVIDWSQIRTVDAGPLGDVDFTRGQRDRDDLVFRELAQL